MKFTIVPYVGALPLKFGMSLDEVAEWIPELKDEALDDDDSGSFNVGALQVAFDQGQLSEVEFYLGHNDPRTGQLARLEPNLEIELDHAPLAIDVLQRDDALDQINAHFEARYEPTIWIYPDLGISFCGYDRSLDYRSLNVFNRDCLEILVDGTTAPPKSTHQRKK